MDNQLRPRQNIGADRTSRILKQRHGFRKLRCRERRILFSNNSGSAGRSISPIDGVRFVMGITSNELLSALAIRGAFVLGPDSSTNSTGRVIASLVVSRGENLSLFG